MRSSFDLTVVGGGLAGSEAALQAARHGLKVQLVEMRPIVSTGAHISGDFSELVCSNSFGSILPDRAPGILKQELRLLGSFLLEYAEQTSVPAGRALAVDRTLFSQLVTEGINSNANIHVTRTEARSIPDGPVIIATGPLTSPNFSNTISQLTGKENLFFFDAIAPIINIKSIDFSIAFRASRYQKDGLADGDYINLPFTKDEYYKFVDLLSTGERIPLKSFEIDIEKGVRAGANKFFEGCLPVEILAQRGQDALAFGPMRPVGLFDPRTNKRPFAVIQLRQDNLAGDLYNMVGFQTNLTIKEQTRIFRNIPGLQQAEFDRYGQMHRNTFIASPNLLLPTLQLRKRSEIFFAGQITGVEGYAGNIATGLLAGWNAARMINGQLPLVLPETTMLGALCRYLTHSDSSVFQPMKANFGILPPIDSDHIKGKRERAQIFAERSQSDLTNFIEDLCSSANQ
jgi:methylenetetrahydrofolate--tRNA-(uracil-5-)-methyltransferase